MMKNINQWWGCGVGFGPWKRNIDLRFFLDQEHFELFSWREDYFYTQFGRSGQFESCNWFTDAGDDSNCFDTVPLQVDRRPILILPMWIIIDILSDYPEL